MPPKRQFSPEFCPLASAKAHVRQLDLILENAILRGTSESVILCGPPGCGKTTIVEEALAPHVSSKKGRVQCVRVDGAIHTELGQCVDAILLQLTGKRAIRANGSLAGSVADKLKELCDALADFSTRTDKKAVVFVIDRLEKLVGQRNQLLLYALFDSARDLAFPLCVVGLSTVMDVLERMEKRVMSRFSQRLITVVDTLFAEPEEFAEAVQFKLALRLQNHSKKEIDAILSSPAYAAVVKELFESRKDWQTINKFVELVLAHRNCHSQTLPDPAVLCAKVSRFFSTDTTQQAISDLTHLQLALLLCCVEFTDAQQVDSFNYNMAREVYLTTVRQKYRSLRFGDPWVFYAFLQLEENGLLRPLVKAARSEPEQFGSFALAVTKLQLQRAFRQMELALLPTDLRQWCEAHM